MSEDIVNRLKKMRGYLPAIPFDAEIAEILDEAIAEIEFLRLHAGAVTRGESFDDIAKWVGRQEKTDEW